MLAVQLHEGQGPSALKVADIPEPEIDRDSVLVQFEASTINPADLKIRNGLIRPRGGDYPYTLGWDLVGRVVSGDGFEPGVRVAGMSAMAATGHGTWSELVAMPRDSLAVVDGALDTVDAAVLAQLPLTGLTALKAVEIAAARADQDVIVIGANGAVGGAVVQILAHRGIHPRALVRDVAAVSPALRRLDVEFIDRAPFGSADTIIDAAGVDLSAALRPGGRYVVVVPGSEPERLPAGAEHVVIRGAASAARTADLLSMLASGALRLPTPDRFALDDIHAAFRAYERRHSGTRVALVSPADPPVRDDG